MDVVKVVRDVRRKFSMTRRIMENGLSFESVHRACEDVTSSEVGKGYRRTATSRSDALMFYDV